MIDVFTEDLLTIAQAASAASRALSRSVGPQVIWRWMRKGVIGRTGVDLVTLDCIKDGRTLKTSRNAINRFLNAWGGVYAPRTRAPRPLTTRRRTPRQRERDLDRTHRELVEAGIAVG